MQRCFLDAADIITSLKGARRTGRSQTYPLSVPGSLLIFDEISVVATALLDRLLHHAIVARIEEPRAITFASALLCDRDTDRSRR
ncbi:hypothetical protein [Ancylobacter oerskovii]|uniref:IstB-like ATP-binding protein domain-containing protein n=1 Tax=Ancylobacter oerskovii TaxID=459519 RepID=A0ABW4Z4V9_9HYPH|nr:hypothetical protein [Ancylobacter oerskovii]